MRGSQDPAGGKELPMSNVLDDMQTGRGYAGPEAEIVPSPSTYPKEVLPGFKQTLTSRRSIRVYDQQPIPEEIMRDCLRDATLAPSSSNLQVYELYWVRQPDKKKRLVYACLGQPAASTAGELVVVVARPDKWKRNLSKLLSKMTQGGTKELPPAVGKYYQELIPKVMQSDPLGVWNLARRVGFTMMGLRKPIVRTPVNRGDHRVSAHVQASLAAQTLMLSLAAHGYDSCPMGGMDAKRIKELLELPRDAEVTMVISAGTRKPEGLYGPRIRLDEADLIKEI